jgi:hypothetical protein
MTRALDRRSCACRALCAAGLTLSLGGCGTQGFAPDALVENPGANAFLTQVGKACGNMNLGTATIAWLIQSQDDVYFVDETTKLYFGDVSKAQYASDMSAFYPVGEHSRTLACIYQQLPEQPPRR